jgi:hypothetical protein
MTLDEAISWAEKQRETWEKSRGQPIVDYFWHVAEWNDGYIVISDKDFKKNLNNWTTVYNTKEKIIYDNN